MRYPVLISIPKSAVDRISRYWEMQVVADADGTSERVHVRVIFPHDDVALHQLIAWAAIADVVEPPELRDRIVACARAILERHTRN